jgi:hypothetical protein
MVMNIFPDIPYTPRVVASVVGERKYLVFVYNNSHDNDIIIWRQQRSASPEEKKFAHISVDSYGFWLIKEYLFRYNYLTGVLDCYNIDMLFRVSRSSSSNFESINAAAQGKIDSINKGGGIGQVAVADDTVYYSDKKSILKVTVDSNNLSQKTLVENKKIDYFTVIEQSNDWEKWNTDFSKEIEDINKMLAMLSDVKANDSRIRANMTAIFNISGIDPATSISTIQSGIDRKVKELRNEYTGYFAENKKLGRMPPLPSIEYSGNLNNLTIAKSFEEYKKADSEKNAIERQMKSNSIGQFINDEKRSWETKFKSIITKNAGQFYNLQNIDDLNTAKEAYEYTGNDINVILRLFKFINDLSNYNTAVRQDISRITSNPSLDKEILQSLADSTKTLSDDSIMQYTLKAACERFKDNRKNDNIYQKIAIEINQDSEIKIYLDDRNGTIKFNETKARSEWNNIDKKLQQANLILIQKKKELYASIINEFKTALFDGMSHSPEKAIEIYSNLPSAWIQNYRNKYSKLLIDGAVIYPLSRANNDAFSVKKNNSYEIYFDDRTKSYRVTKERIPIGGRISGLDGVFHIVSRNGKDAIVFAGRDKIEKITRGNDFLEIEDDVLPVKLTGNSYMEIPVTKDSKFDTDKLRIIK